LSDKLQRSPQPSEAAIRVAEKLETQFNERVQYFLELEGKYREAQKLIDILQPEVADPPKRRQ
jgi:hypothetical protein